MKEIKDGLLLTIKSTAHGELTDCGKCFFHNRKTMECDLNLGGCYLPHPYVFVKARVSDIFKNMPRHEKI